MTRREIRVVEVSGAPRERGRAHGEACRTQICDFVHRWKDYLQAKFGLEPDEFISGFVRETGFFGAIDRWTPGLLDEVRGIGEGAGLDFQMAFVLSCYDEVWWYYHNRSLPAPAGASGGCTALGVFGQPGLPPIVGQNMDVGLVYDGAQVLLRIKGTDGTPDALVFTFAGCVAMNGLNDRAIAICANTLADLDHAHDGLPVAFVHRGVLAQPTYEKAVQFCKGVKHASGQNYTIGGPNRVIDLECSANKVVEFAPFPGLNRVCHTNHSIANDDMGMFQRRQAAFNAEQKQRADFSCANTVNRYNTAERAIEDASKTVTVEDIKAVLRSEDMPSPICMYSEEHQVFSAASMIMSLSSSPELHLTFGPPCGQEYQVFRF